ALPETDQVRVARAQRRGALAAGAIDGGHAQLAVEQVVDFLGAIVEVQPDGRAGIEPRVDGQLEPGREEALLEARLLREDPLGEVLAAAAAVASLRRVLVRREVEDARHLRVVLVHRPVERTVVDLADALVKDVAGNESIVAHLVASKRTLAPRTILSAFSTALTTAPPSRTCTTTTRATGSPSAPMTRPNCICRSLSAPGPLSEIMFPAM